MSNKIKKTFLLFLSFCLAHYSQAQTDADGLMMSKNKFCTGLVYNYSSWQNYWEGSFKRDNANLGTVSTQMLGIMGTYGVTNKLNIQFGIPYVSTNASAGTLHGMKGLQDLSLWAKYKVLEKKVGTGNISLFTLAGISLPVSNYVADYLPLSIGLHSKTLSGRVIADYQIGKFFATGSATYIFRNNVTIDRTAYYTTEMHNSNEVKMPDAFSENLRIGYRSVRFTAEAVLDNWNTLGGFDIRKNDMPFVSNKMNWTTTGLGFKYNVRKVSGLSFIAGGNTTIAGRNVGQSSSGYGGMFYVMSFSKNRKQINNNTK